jgi:hypothetical protein
LTEACGWSDPPRYIIRDRDGAYGNAFVRRLTAMGIGDRPISARSLWQNGVAERLIGSIRRECLDHVALIRFSAATKPCRQQIIDYDQKYAAWEMPYMTAMFQNTDVIRMGLEAGELTVGEANKELIEAQGKVMVAHSQGQAQQAAIAAEQNREAAIAVADGLAKAGQAYSNAALANCPTTCTTFNNSTGSGQSIGTITCH